MTALLTALGRTPHTEALFTDPAFDMQPFPVISRAFAPMVREQRFQVSEMAIATAIQAKAHGSDLVLVPVVLAARHQQGAMLRRAADPFGPDGLRGKRVGVRAYSQTTGMWLRGAIQEETGITPPEIRWVTFEDPHVAAARDPAWAERALPGSDMLAMLRDGTLDAAVFGAETPSAPDLATVWPDPAAAGAAFQARHGIVPINHMMMVRAEVARTPGLVAGLVDRFRGGPFPTGRAAIDPAVQLALLYCMAQGLIPRMLTLEEVWA